MEYCDSDSNILKEIRMKYAEDLEEIIECPICFEIPTDIVNICQKGHHICLFCKLKLEDKGENCPTCQSQFTSCRNFAVERLSSTFDDIKSSLLDPKHGSNRRVIKNLISVQIQTDNINSNNICSNQTQTECSQNDCIFLKQLLNNDALCIQNLGENVNTKNMDNKVITSNQEDYKKKNCDSRKRSYTI